MDINTENSMYLLKKCGSIQYRCTNKNCSASLLVNKDVKIVISMLNDHNHNVIAENIVGRQIICQANNVNLLTVLSLK